MPYPKSRATGSVVVVVRAVGSICIAKSAAAADEVEEECGMCVGMLSIKFLKTKGT